MKNRFRTAVVVLALALGSILVTPQPALADSAIPYPNWQELMSALGLALATLHAASRLCVVSLLSFLRHPSRLGG